MSPMPLSCRKTAGLFVLLLDVLPAAGSYAAPPPAPVAKPIPLTASKPTPASSPATQPASADAKPKPPHRAAPKPGPGANDAGHGAIDLRTTKLALYSLIDRSVTGLQKREIGHVVDVLVDQKGAPAALVVDVGGFMGMGDRRIAIGWERFALSGRKAGDALQIPFSDAQIRAAPAYDGSREVTVIQGSSKAAAKPAVVRLGLGEDPGPLSNDDAAPADSLNPD